jgi:hypothetical protein
MTICAQPSDLTSPTRKSEPSSSAKIFFSKKSQVMVRYYGLYADAHRGKVRKAGLAPLALPMVEDTLRRIPSKGWAEKPPPTHVFEQVALMAAEAAPEYYS